MSATVPARTSLLERLFQPVGARFLVAMEELGHFGTIGWGFFYWTWRRPFEVREWIRQMVRIGVDSIPVVGMTAIFTGGVMTLQTVRGFQRFHAESYVGSVVGLAITREVGPVITALMIAGRIGSSLAAELGTMRVTEQIDALHAMGVEPVQYLVVPRVGASVCVMPALVALANALGIYGGFVIATKLLGANPVAFYERTFMYLELNDITSGLIKAAVFGLILSVVSCAKGFYTSGGAEGVGRATTAATVASSVGILIADFFLTKLMF